MSSLFDELKRRRVFRVAGVYAAVAFIVWQAADIAFPALHLPAWMVTAVVALTIVGFPIALVLAWAFDITPDGVVRTEAEVQDDERHRGPHVVVSRATLRTQRIAAAAGVLILALAGGAFIVLGSRDVSVGDELDRSVAVLPFANLSGDQENEYFSDGITDDILIQLAKIADLKVISRSSVMAYKRTSLRLREIGEELDVAHILDGSVRRDGNRVRIAAQLVDARTDRHLWAETYDRELTGIFEIQSEIAQQIARALQARLSPAERSRIAALATTSPEAYELYLRGREHRMRGDESSRQLALGVLREALRIDPEFAPAHAELAHAHLALARSVSPAEIDSATLLARRAIQLAPERTEGHHALANAMRRGGRHDLAAESYRRAYELSPNDPVAIGGLGWVHMLRGEHDEALRWRKRALALDPASGFRHRQVGVAYEALEEFDLAARHYRRAVDLTPGIWFFHGDLIRHHLRSGEIDAAAERLREMQRIAVNAWETWEAAAAIELARGDTSAAIALLERVNAQPARDLPVISLAYLYWERGDHARAETIFRGYESTALSQIADGQSRGSVLYRLARIHAMRGDTERAVAMLEEAHRAGAGAQAFRVEPLPDALLADPRVQRIRDEIFGGHERQRQRARQEGWE